MPTSAIFFLRFQKRKRRLVLFSWKDKFLMNVNVLSAPAFGGRDGTARAASLRNTVDLLLVIPFAFHHPAEHRRSLPRPLFQRVHPLPAGTACLRRGHSWWIVLPGLSSNTRAGLPRHTNSSPCFLSPFIQFLFINYRLCAKNDSISPS